MPPALRCGGFPLPLNCELFLTVADKNPAVLMDMEQTEELTFLSIVPLADAVLELLLWQKSHSRGDDVNNPGFRR
jgi:hypothetical protein